VGRNVQSFRLLADGQIVRGLDHRFALSKPALPSAPSKKSFSSVSSPQTSRCVHLRKLLRDQSDRLATERIALEVRTVRTSGLAITTRPVRLDLMTVTLLGAASANNLASSTALVISQAATSSGRQPGCGRLIVARTVVSKPPRRSGLMRHRKCSPVRTR
jgi:hypothetical protein